MGSIGAQLVKAGWQTNDGQRQVVHLAAQFADSDEWARAGFSSPSRWMADKLEIARRTANEWIRIGRCLKELSSIALALEERRISFTKCKELTRSATPDNERALLALAEHVPANELGQAIAAWLQRFEPGDVIDTRHRQDRTMRWQTERDGMVAFMARLPPSEAGVIIAAVESQAMAQSQSQRLTAEEWPSLAQQRADALVECISGGGAAISTEVVIHVRGDGATLDDGTPITISAVAKLIDSSFIRLLIHDVERRPINASSKQRHPTARQRRVVKERDRVCIDCGSSELLQYDHVPDFAETKRTVVDELRLRCATCHRFRHSKDS